MVLITGGTGAVGQRLIQALRRKGALVRVLTLPYDDRADELAGEGVEVCYGDITKIQTFRSCFRGVRTVYHCAAVILSPDNPRLFREINVEGTRNTVILAEHAGVDHFVYISSASVTYVRSNDYSRSKKQAEAIVLQSRIPHKTIVRPTLVYGNGGGAEFIHFVRHLKRFPVVPFIGDGNVMKRPVHADDLVRGLAAIHRNPVSYGKVYNLSGGEAVTLRRMAEILMHRTGKHKAIIPVPVILCRVGAVVCTMIMRITDKKLLLTWQTISGMTQPADLDNTEACADLGFAPRGFSEQAARTGANENPGARQ